MSPFTHWFKHWTGHSPRKISGRKRKRSPCRLNLEQLESRVVPAIIGVNGSVTLDESLGLQNIGSPAPGDANDNDVALATLQSGASAFSNRLFNSVASGGLGLSTTFATTNGVAESASNFITVTGGTVTSLGFAQDDGTALPVYAGVATGGVTTSLSAVDGDPISLFADATLGNRMVLGVDSNNDIAFAIFMDPIADLTSARVWMVQFEALSNPDPNNPDDLVDLTGFLDVAASTFLTFDFNNLPSGQNLFGTVGDTSNALVVIGKTPVLNSDGTYTNASNTINTSQGGGKVTIGVNNQMFDPGEGAYFTYVKSPVANFLAGVPGGLDQNEADDADNIQYTGGTLAATSASTTISQTQGNATASMKITAYDISGSPQGRDFVSGLGSGAPVTITSVKVNGVAVNFTPSGNGVIVSGLHAGDKIEWTTSAPHDRVLIEDVAGKFDIGGFGVNQPNADHVDVGSQLRFEDDGPSITASATGAPTLTVDETVLTTDASASFAAQFTKNFGTDGPGATPVTYALSTPGGPSGLIDTATNESVVLSLNASGQVVGTTATTGLTVFVVSVNSSDVVTLDQQRAVVHPDTNNPDDSKTLLAANLVVLTATITDGDGDQASAPLNIGQQLVFKDDGPSITATATGAPTLTVDETVLGTDDTKLFSGQFTPSFGADGPGATPVSYALSTPGGASGLTDTATGQSVVLSLVNGQVVGKTAVSGDIVFVVSVDASGNVKLDQQRAVVHSNPNDPDESRGLTGSNLVVLTATATDKDGDHASAPLDLTPLLVFKDDGPSITATATGAPTLRVDETILATDDTKAFSGQFTPSFGADGPGATPVSYALSTPGGASGLTDTATGQSVVLTLESGQVVGRAGAAGPIVFVVSVDSSGQVTLDQRRAIVHSNPNDPDESRGLTGSNLVVLTATATDKDGDHASVPLDLTPLLVFKDDGPSIGPIANSIVDFAKNSSATKTLNGAVGADPNTGPYTIDSFPASITINGTELHGIASNNNTTITYWADTNGDTIFGNTGDTAFYKLELSQTANSGAGSYTFTVLVDPPPAVLKFDFNSLHSGSNLFGTVGDANNALIVIAENPVISADGTLVSSPNGVIKTSKGGGPTTIGVNSQMFDPGEGAYFTYVKSPNQDFLGSNLSQTEANDADNILYNGGTNTATSASTTISQIQGNSLATMKITAFDIAGSPQARDFVSGLGSGTKASITSVHVFDANGNDVTGNKVTLNADGSATVSGLDAGFTIAWTTSAPHDRVLIEGVAGKFDIGGFTITQAQPTPDQRLDFVARATDGDGDFKTASFSIGIDGTGINHDGHVAGVG